MHHATYHFSRLRNLSGVFSCRSIDFPYCVVSVLRDDFAPDSDVDVLVEFMPGHVPGLAFFDMEEELSHIIGRKVDLNTPQFLSRYFRDMVLKEAEVLYDAA